MRFRRNDACRIWVEQKKRVLHASFFAKAIDTSRVDDGFRQKARKKERAFCLYPSYAIVHVTRSVPAEHDARQPPGRERHHDGCEPVEDTMFARGGRYVLFESKFVDLEG